MKNWLYALGFVAMAALIGAGIGYFTGDFRADSALGGALVGLFVGSWLSLRIYAHRNARPIQSDCPADETDASSRSVHAARRAGFRQSWEDSSGHRRLGQLNPQSACGRFSETPLHPRQSLRSL